MAGNLPESEKIELQIEENTKIADLKKLMYAFSGVTLRVYNKEGYELIGDSRETLKLSGLRRTGSIDIDHLRTVGELEASFKAFGIQIHVADKDDILNLPEETILSETVEIDYPSQMDLSIIPSRTVGFVRSKFQKVFGLDLEICEEQSYEMIPDKETLWKAEGCDPDNSGFLSLIDPTKAKSFRPGNITIYSSNTLKEVKKIFAKYNMTVYVWFSVDRDYNVEHPSWLTLAELREKPEGFFQTKLYYHRLKSKR